MYFFFFLLGIVSTSPLKLELEFSPVPSADDMTWFLSFTFVYLNKINFPGIKTKQDVSYDYVISSLSSSAAAAAI
jgi:hypothetical protein